MGNSQGKEARPSFSSSTRRHHSSSVGSGSHWRSPYGDFYHGDTSRLARSSGPDLGLLGLGGSSDRHAPTVERRRETRQEREARRQERERVARIKERERSMKEEHVDGGYLVTQGVYVGPEDFNKVIVRQLMVCCLLCPKWGLMLTVLSQIERRLAPFWKGLNDFSESWTEHQLVAAARGLPIPPPDQVPPELESRFARTSNDNKELSSSDPRSVEQLGLHIDASFRSDGSHQLQASPPSSPPTGSPLLRSRAKTLASLTTSLKPGSQEAFPREMQLPYDPYVNGQAMEAYLYKDSTECPICFLYYPPYLNHTRCCDQPICSECFVQIKRPDPHPPEHGEESQSGGEGEQQQRRPEAADAQLVSEPSACPFCVQPEFGVTYIPPPFRRGLAYNTDQAARSPMNIASSVSSTSSLSSGNVPPPTSVGRRRGASLSTSDPSVVTTDKIRPDWAQKLANARSQASRRAAAATALHTAAYLVNTNGNNDSRGLLGRRSGGRRGLSESQGSGSSHRGGSPALQALAYLTDGRRGAGHEGGGGGGGDYPEEESRSLAPPRGSSRRTRIDDLEEMMMMEAVRLSLASEEERQKKVEKEAKKDAKKREKESKKVDKVSRKVNGQSEHHTPSELVAGSKPRDVGSSSSSIMGDDSLAGKGKGVDRTSGSASASNSNMTATSPILVDTSDNNTSLMARTPSPTEQSKQRLRNVSSASSFSSLVEQTPDERVGPYSTTDGSNSSLEPMFNFRSLAEVIGDEEKRDQAAEHVEDSTVMRAKAESSGQPFLPEIKPTEPLTEESYIPKELETRSIGITSTSPKTTT